jgi:hypothetical protein
MDADADATAPPRTPVMDADALAADRHTRLAHRGSHAFLIIPANDRPSRSIAGLGLCGSIVAN